MLHLSENLKKYRMMKNLTQEDVAEYLRITPQSVSKWERGESVPDIVVLKAVSDIFGVTVDYLITDGHDATETVVDESVPKYARDAKKHRMHRVITGMSVLLVWVIATILFIIFDASWHNSVANYLIIAYAVVASMLVWLVFNSIWHNRRRNYLIISGLMWSVLLAVHTSILVGGFNLWQMYLLGIPGQIIIVLWSIIGKKK